MNKRFVSLGLILGLTVVSLFLFPSTSQASNLGNITYYDSDFPTIGRWSGTPRTTHQIANSFTTSNFLSYVNHARNQWRNAGISIATTSTNPNITFHGGDRTSMRLRSGTLPYNAAAATYFEGYRNEGTWYYRGAPKTGLRMTKASIYIVYESGKSSSVYKNLATHELGHALGWYKGHTIRGSANVMYHTESTRTNLSTSDKRHIGQIY